MYGFEALLKQGNKDTPLDLSGHATRILGECWIGAVQGVLRLGMCEGWLVVSNHAGIIIKVCGLALSALSYLVILGVFNLILVLLLSRWLPLQSSSFLS